MQYSYQSRVFLVGTFAALASILQILEISLNIPIPFVKLGISYCIVLYFLFKEEYLMSFLINFLRILIGGFFSGRLFSFPFLYSFIGGNLSFFIMFILFVTGKNKVSKILISIVGAYTYNISQLLLIGLFLHSYETILTFPILFVILSFSIIAGTLVGLVTYKLELYTQDISFSIAKNNIKE